MPLTRKRFLGLAGRGALGAAAYTTFGFFERTEAGEAVAGKPCAGMEVSKKRFLYRGNAVGIGGRIIDPPLGEIPAQAATSLPPDGGNAEARVEGYGFHGIVYVNSAFSVIRGNPDLKTVLGRCDKVFRTVTTATVNGLDVDGVVRADSIVASLESEQPEDETSLKMLTVGYFTNLRIKGYSVNPQPHSHLLTAAKKSEIDSCLDHLYDPYDPVNEYDPFDPRFDQANPKRESPPKPTSIGYSKTRSPRRGSYVCSIFDDQSIANDVAKIPGSAGVKALPGGHIRVRDFGDIYLGEFIVEGGEKDDDKKPDEYVPESRRLTMLRIVLASPPTGNLNFASVEGDGRPH